MNKNNTYKPLVSIVTVVYNSVDFIENTIKSVINQEYKNIEYIVIDGASTDGTLDIINKYKEHINIFVSEKDSGLYDAMNKAIGRASGDYLWFINSGDEAYSAKNLCAIFESLSTSEKLPDIIYGETEVIDQEGKPVGMRRHSAPEKLNWRTFRFGMKVCHQSAIVKRESLDFYDTKYEYSSDFDWFIKALKKSEYIYNSHLILSKFMEGGLTEHSLLPSLKERFAIMRKYYGLVPTFFNHIYLAVKLGFYYLKNKRF